MAPRLTSVCVLGMFAAVAVAKPHRCFMNEYANSMATQGHYYPMPTELYGYDDMAKRLGRSNEPGKLQMDDQKQKVVEQSDLETDTHGMETGPNGLGSVPTKHECEHAKLESDATKPPAPEPVKPAPEPSGLAPETAGFGNNFPPNRFGVDLQSAGYGAASPHVTVPVAQTSPYLYGYYHHPGGQGLPTAPANVVPCGCQSVVPKTDVNDTAVAAAATTDRLTAYYDQLKFQQEMMARHQFQQQLYEQQQRRQQEYLMVQQQIQQQYYQQQQQAMYMLDQLKQNPAFVEQLAAFMNEKHGVHDGPAPAASTPASAPVATPMKPEKSRPKDGDKVPEKERVVKVETDSDSVSEFKAKVVEARQASEENYEYDQPPTVEKVYTMISD